MRLSPRVRRALIRRAFGYPAFLVALLGLLWLVSIRMPGESHRGPLPALTPAEDFTRAQLAAHVAMLAGTIGTRNLERMPALDSAAAFIEAAWQALGYTVTSQRFTADGKAFRNLEITIPGRRAPSEIVVVGAHYDTVIETPGADDNASGTAGLIELARLLRSHAPARTIKLVAFTNEEPPFFFTENMGSRQYARAARVRGDNIIAMLSLETIGYFRDEDGSQQYPPILSWFYPARGDFIAVAGNIGSRALVHRVIAGLRRHTAIPTQGTAAPHQIPGISWSDQWSFWKEDYQAVMISDTAPFRNAHYHLESDKPVLLDFGRMARVVHGISRVVDDLAGS